MQNKKVKFLAHSAAIAALYVVLTLLANAFGLANYAIQVRFSEALTILPLFTPAAIPGLFVGCLLSNILTGCLPMDILCGSIATILGACGTYLIGAYLSGKKFTKYLAVLPPIVANTIIVPPLLAFIYCLEGSLWYFAVTVCIGEIISCGILGLILYAALNKHKAAIFG